MTKSELHAVMTGGFGTIAGGVLAAFIGFGVSILAAFIGFGVSILAAFIGFGVSILAAFVGFSVSILAKRGNKKRKSVPIML